jgi:hypothetical protein
VESEWHEGGTINMNMKGKQDDDKAFENLIILDIQPHCVEQTVRFAGEALGK